MMIELSIQRLRYPDWFDIGKKSTDNEEEEVFIELRDDLVSFLEPLVQKENFKLFIMEFIDNFIAKI
jgi:hypothetical protein